MAKRHSGKSWWVVLRWKLMGGIAVVDERVELTRAGLVSMEVRASCAMVVVVVVVVAGI